jgi:serine/threonine protein phosphatase 1
LSSRTLAIGDIHGCDTALEKLLAEVAPASDDTVVILGDVVDRGPGSREVIEQLLALRERCRMIFIMGNHEEMMLDALQGGGWFEGWLRYGGTATLCSYNGDPQSIPPEHIDFLKSGINYWQTERELFIHANLEPGVDLDAQNSEWLRWTHLTGEEPVHPSGKRIICGHTPQRYGDPLVFPGWVGIDTFACGTGWLTCLDVDTNAIWQTTQSAKFRAGTLKEVKQK